MILKYHLENSELITKTKLLLTVNKGRRISKITLIILHPYLVTKTKMAEFFKNVSSVTSEVCGIDNDPHQVEVKMLNYIVATVDAFRDGFHCAQIYDFHQDGRTL